jgi:DNA invertase Pin-like site-specific DNA recombinase
MVTYKRVALYARVSHDEQKKYGFSIQAQIDKTVKYARENGYEIIEVFKDEGYTATKMKRPALLAMLDRLNEFDVIIFTRLDRFTRNVLQANKMVELLDSHGVAIKSIEEDDIDTSTADGRFSFNLRVSLAQREAEKTSERLKSIFEFKIEKGQPVTGNQPFGYTIDYVDNKKIIVKDPKAANIVEDVFKHFAMYHSIRGALLHVNGKYDKAIHYRTINKMIIDPLYAGEYNGNPNYYPPYITKEEFAKNKLRVKANVCGKKDNRIYLFTSLMRCPACGWKMMGKYTNKMKDGVLIREYHHYVCRNRHTKGKTACTQGSSINEKKIEKFILENIEKLVQEHILEVKQVIPQEQTDLPTNRIKEILEEMDTLNYMFQKKRIDVKKYDKDYLALERELANLQKQVPSESDITILEEFLSSDWKTIYDSLDKENKRALWRNLIKEIKLDKDYNISIEFL